MKYTAAIITISDKGSRGERTDKSGPLLADLIEGEGFEVVDSSIIPDEKDLISAELIKYADEAGVSLILTTGGTGLSQRDVTPEATKAVIEREVPGIPEAMRAESMKITPMACLSRSVCGTRGRTLIINLPGSPKAVEENLRPVLPALRHAVEILDSQGSADCGRSQ